MEDTVTYSHCPACDSKQIEPVLSVKDYTVSGEVFDIWHCSHCTMRFTQKVPAESSIGRYYASDNYISHTDTKKGLVNSLYHVIRKKTLSGKRKLVEEVTGLHHGNLLDIGAGTGAFLQVMKTAGWTTTGLEPDETTRKRASELYGINLQTSGQLFQLPVSSFDAVTMWHVLEHVHALHDYLSQIKKLLTTAGRLFIAVPNYTSADAQVYREFWAAYDVPRHLYHFSPASMKTVLQKHGLKLIQTKPMWYDSFYVSMLSEQYKTGSSRFVQAFGNGLLSNYKAIGNPELCSSLIYIVSKNL